MLLNGLYILSPGQELTLSQSHLPGENAAHFLQLEPFTIFRLVPPGTHYCWVDRGTCVDAKLAQGFYT